MRHRQTGVTFIGWIILLIPIVIVGFALIRLMPVYINSFKVGSAMEQVAAEFAGEERPNVAAVRSALQSRFDVEDIDNPQAQDVHLVPGEEGWVLEVQYEQATALFGPLSLLANFSKSVALR
ncbi:MAG: DUF4845 domain-containing protein [Nevskiaceae bacterium]|jgi:hypothetical protein|nr:DUF4845 domain-containing protein [Nevskiaceae bacterium]